MANNLRIDVRNDFRQVAVQFELRTTTLVNAAAVRALNRTATTVRAEASRQIRGRYSLKAGTVRKQLRIERATRNRLTSAVIASGAPIPLVEFGARQTKKGVTVKVTKTRKLVKGVFIARMKSGKVGVFERLGSKRLPIRELFSVSLPRTFTQRQILAALRKTAADRFRIELARELRFRTGAANG
jgi:hypothetical protein